MPGGHGFKLLALPFFLIATFGVGLLGENIGLLGCALALNTCEDEEGKTAWFVRHAEQAALDKLVKSTESADGATMMISHAPCQMCSLRIKDAGIKKVYYRHAYRDNSGVEYLQANGVNVERI